MLVSSCIGHLKHQSSGCGSGSDCGQRPFFGEAEGIFPGTGASTVSIAAENGQSGGVVVHQMKPGNSKLGIKVSQICY